MIEEIRFSGDFNSLDEKERVLVRGLFSNFYPKVKLMLNNEISFEVVFKDYKKLGSRTKFSVVFKLVAPTDIFEVSVVDWDLARVVHKACVKMATEIEHRLHVSDK